MGSLLLASLSRVHCNAPDVQHAQVSAARAKQQLTFSKAVRRLECSDNAKGRTQGSDQDVTKALRTLWGALQTDGGQQAQREAFRQLVRVLEAAGYCKQDEFVSSPKAAGQRRPNNHQQALQPQHPGRNVPLSRITSVAKSVTPPQPWQPQPGRHMHEASRHAHASVTFVHATSRSQQTDCRASQQQHPRMSRIAERVELWRRATPDPCPSPEVDDGSSQYLDLEEVGSLSMVATASDDTQAAHSRPRPAELAAPDSATCSSPSLKALAQMPGAHRSPFAPYADGPGMHHHCQRPPLSGQHEAGAFPAPYRHHSEGARNAPHQPHWPHSLSKSQLGPTCPGPAATAYPAIQADAAPVAPVPPGAHQVQRPPQKAAATAHRDAGSRGHMASGVLPIERMQPQALAPAAAHGMHALAPPGFTTERQAQALERPGQDSTAPAEEVACPHAVARTLVQAAAAAVQLLGGGAGMQAAVGPHQAAPSRSQPPVQACRTATPPPAYHQEPSSLHVKAPQPTLHATRIWETPAWSPGQDAYMVCCAEEQATQREPAGGRSIASDAVLLRGAPGVVAQPEGPESSIPQRNKACIPKAPGTAQPASPAAGALPSAEGDARTASHPEQEGFSRASASGLAANDNVACAVGTASSTPAEEHRPANRDDAQAPASSAADRAVPATNMSAAAPYTRQIGMQRLSSSGLVASAAVACGLNQGLIKPNVLEMTPGSLDAAASVPPTAPCCASASEVTEQQQQQQGAGGNACEDVLDQDGTHDTAGITLLAPLSREQLDDLLRMSPSSGSPASSPQQSSPHMLQSPGERHQQFGARPFSPGAAGQQSSSACVSHGAEGGMLAQGMPGAAKECSGSGTGGGSIADEEALALWHTAFSRGADVDCPSAGSSRRSTADEAPIPPVRSSPPQAISRANSSQEPDLDFSTHPSRSLTPASSSGGAAHVLAGISSAGLPPLAPGTAASPGALIMSPAGKARAPSPRLSPKRSLSAGGLEAPPSPSRVLLLQLCRSSGGGLQSPLEQTSRGGGSGALCRYSSIRESLQSLSGAAAGVTASVDLARMWAGMMGSDGFAIVTRGSVAGGNSVDFSLDSGGWAQLQDEAQRLFSSGPLVQDGPVHEVGHAAMTNQSEGSEQEDTAGSAHGTGGSAQQPAFSPAQARTGKRSGQPAPEHNLSPFQAPSAFGVACTSGHFAGDAQGGPVTAAPPAVYGHGFGAAGGAELGPDAGDEEDQFQPYDSPLGCGPHLQPLGDAQHNPFAYQQGQDLAALQRSASSISFYHDGSSISEGEDHDDGEDYPAQEHGDGEDPWLQLRAVAGSASLAGQRTPRRSTSSTVAAAEADWRSVADSLGASPYRSLTQRSTPASSANTTPGPGQRCAASSGVDAHATLPRSLGSAPWAGAEVGASTAASRLEAAVAMAALHAKRASAYSELCGRVPPIMGDVQVLGPVLGAASSGGGGEGQPAGEGRSLLAAGLQVFKRGRRGSPEQA